jgi:predicted RND superfamily exporter protein
MLLLVLAALAPAAWAASHLGLVTDFKDLLPRRRASIVEMERITAHLDGGVSLQVAIEGRNLPAMERLARDLSARLRRLPASLIARVDESFAAERAFFEDHRWLFASYEDLEAANDALRHRLLAKTPFALDLDEPGEHAEPATLDLERKLKKKLSAWDRFPDGYYVGEGGHLLAVFVTVPSAVGSDFRAARLLVDRVRSEVSELQPTRDDASIRVTLTGDLVTGIREYAALKADILWSTSICVGLVLLVIVLYFGRLRSLGILSVTLVVGVGWTFGFARLAIGYLNTSTGFLGSIVAGNGINFAIVMLARYFEERRRGAGTEAALEHALGGTAHGTAGAALAAALAYGSLTLTDFRGFNQFGVIGGVGMLLCWMASYTCGPALIVLSERIPWLARRTARSWRSPMAVPFLALRRRAPRAAWLIPLVAMAAGGALTVHFLVRDPFEYDFRQLRSRLSDADGAVTLGKRTARIRDAGHDGVVLLADTRAQARTAASVLARDPAVGHAYTFDDLVPERQAEKLALLAHIRRTIDKILPLLDEKERAEVLAARPPDGLQAVADGDVPAKLRWPFVEKDGTLGRTVLVTSPPGHSSWDGHYLLGFARAVAETHLPDGTVVRAAGQPLIFADILRSVLTDGPRAVAFSLAGVLVLVLGAVRGVRASLLVLGTVVGGVAVSLGLASLAGMRLSFLNFVAIPITIGVGADYAINLVRRQLDEPWLTAEQLLEGTGGAIVLCSLTTIIGYGTLLVATSRAIASFGLLAVFGEAACLMTAVLVVPAFVRGATGKAITSPLSGADRGRRIDAVPPPFEAAARSAYQSRQSSTTSAET